MSDMALVKILQYRDDERIGMRALYKGGGGQYWGYLESIEQYADGIEAWCVIEIGGTITMYAASDHFELISGEKRDFTLSPVSIREEKPKVDLPPKTIYQLLLEAFDLQRTWGSTYNRRSYKALNAIQSLLAAGATQQAKIETAFVAMLKDGEQEGAQREHIARQTAQKIAQLRSL